jgi:hypothetical protein
MKTQQTTDIVVNFTAGAGAHIGYQQPAQAQTDVILSVPNNTQRCKMLWMLRQLVQ